MQGAEIGLAVALLLLGAWIVGALVAWIRAERDERKWRHEHEENPNG